MPETFATQLTNLTRPDYQQALAELRRRLNISPEEPLFLLRAQDWASAFAVHAWITAAQQHGANETILAAALEIARAMEGWPVKQVPDL